MLVVVAMTTTTRRTNFALLALIVLATSAAAQPSDRQIKKDLTDKATLKIKLVGKGTVQLNTDTLNYEYIRGAEILLKSSYQGINVIVTGDAVYQKVGKNKYTYWKFRVFENRYEGIPNPKPEEIAALLATEPVKQYGEGFASNIVKVIEPPALAENPEWVWHEPKSVSFKMVTKVETIASNTETETERVTLDVRLYRDDMKGPWRSFMASTDKRESLGRNKHTADEIAKMLRLPQQAAEIASKAAVAKLPAVQVPEFASPEELARFIHRALREGPRDRAEATLRAVIAPQYYAPGSAVLLSNSGQQMIDGALDEAFGRAVTYGVEYCAEPVVETSEGSRMVRLRGVKDTFATDVFAVKTGGKLVDGVEVGAKWMLDDLDVRVWDSEADRAWIASFSDRKKLCPKD